MSNVDPENTAQNIPPPPPAYIQHESRGTGHLSDVVILQGCIHGEIQRCYRFVRDQSARVTPRLCVWSGDVQTPRHQQDLDSMACPPKYKSLRDFPDYYNGRKQAPCLTVFIGGNHEASDFLNELPFGGWVAPNIYYLGKSSVINFGGKRIGALSGIFKSQDYYRGYYEVSPLSPSDQRSIYHVRDFDVSRLSWLEGTVDMVLTHDWPTGVITDKQDQARLLKRKPYFADELARGELGNPHLMRLLHHLRPYGSHPRMTVSMCLAAFCCRPLWVSAHLHVTFNSTFVHNSEEKTLFVTHDKPKQYVSASFLNLKSDVLHFGVGDRGLQNGISLTAKKEEHSREAITKDLATSLEAAECVQPDETAQPGESAQPDESAQPGESAESLRKKRRLDQVDEWRLQVDGEWLWILRTTIPLTPIGNHSVTVAKATSVDSPSRSTMLKIAKNVDEMMKPEISWVRSLDEHTGTANDTISLQYLSTLKAPIPDWNELSYKDTRQQRHWWLRVLDLPESDDILERIRDRRPTGNSSPQKEPGTEPFSETISERVRREVDVAELDTSNDNNEENPFLS